MSNARPNTRGIGRVSSPRSLDSMSRPSATHKYIRTNTPRTAGPPTATTAIRAHRRCGRATGSRNARRRRATGRRLGGARRTGGRVATSVLPLGHVLIVPLVLGHDALCAVSGAHDHRCGPANGGPPLGVPQGADAAVHHPIDVVGLAQEA